MAASSLLAAGCLLCGCESQQIARDRPAEVVDLGVFQAPSSIDASEAVAAAPASDTLAAADVVDEPPPVMADPRAEEFPLGAAGPAVDPATGTTEEPPRVLSRPLDVGDRLVVDSMVGQVNGRPIFADDFFLPIEDALIALSQRTTPQEFIRQATLIVSEELRQVVLNSLFLAEAQATLTPQERVGLFAWAQQLREQVTAGLGGTEVEAERQLLEREGQTIESKLRDLQDRALIRKLLDERITPRVIVSWKDIEREYRKDRWQERYNPPGKVTLARIRLMTESDAELLESVKERLAGGENFVEVAESLEVPGSGIWQTFEGRLESVELANETLQAQLAALKDEGDTTPPFELGPTTWWVHVAEIDRPEPRSLYDPQVQRELAAYIRSVRATEEQNRYIETLLEEGIYDELDQMVARLVTIAVLRYGP